MIMLFVTLHGGKSGKKLLDKNMHASDKDGQKIAPSVLEDTEGVILDELRGVCHFGNYLYVVNANQTQNSVLCYQGSATSYRFVGKFVSPETCTSVMHPFDFTFDGAGYCYISSQATNVVTRLAVSADGRIGTPAPVAAALPAPGKF